MEAADMAWASNQRRRVSKPLIEKRRRARINRSLSQLVEIVAKPDKVPENRTARLEKAYILEMTVEYLRKTRDSNKIPEKSYYDDYENSFQAGYRLCMTEVHNFLNKQSDQNIPEEFPTKSLQRYLNRKLKSPINSITSRTQTTQLTSKLSRNNGIVKQRETCIRLHTDAKDLFKDRCVTQYSSVDSSSSISPVSTEDESTTCVSESESSSGEGHVFYNSKSLVLNQDMSRDELNLNSFAGPVWRPW